MVVALGRRSEADRLSRAFGRALAGVAPARPLDAGGLLGLEHEFRVLVAGTAIDFGQLIHRLSIDGRRVDPADPNAYRGSWGGAITADGREAEIAVAPVERGPGCTAELLARARLGRSLLAGAVPPEAVLEGYSTHLSVAVPDGLAERAARIYARTFAPALMLLLDGPDSPGLLVRPRPGRLELGGEFVDGERLRAVAAFVAGSVRVAALAARRRPFAGRHLPLAVEVAMTPAIERFGWFVGREAFGGDLYATGRRTRLRLRRGGTIEAGEHLARCWAVARRAIEDLVSPDDLAAADRLVVGAAPLGIEGSQAEAIAFEGAPGSAAMMTEGSHPDPGGAFGLAVVPRSRPGFEVTPAIVSWDFVVLRLDGDGLTGYACLPRRLLGPGLEALDRGRLDVLLAGYLEATRRGSGRILASNRQTGAAGLYGAVGRAADLLRSEHSPLGGVGDRPGKRRRDDRPQDQAQQSTPEHPTPAGSSAARVVRTTGAAAGTATVGLAAVGTSSASAAAPSAGAAATETASAISAPTGGGAVGSAAGGSGGGTAGTPSAIAAGGSGAARILGLPVAAVAAIVGVVVIAVVGGAVLAGSFGAANATPSPPPASLPAFVPTPMPSASASLVPSLIPSPLSTSVAPGGPGPSGQVLAPDPSCLKEPGLKSTSGANPKTIQFVNHTAIPLQAFWLSYEGKRVFYQLVPAGQTRSQATWVTHPWVLADSNGTCMKLFVTQQDTTTMQIGP